MVRLKSVKFIAAISLVIIGLIIGFFIFKTAEVISVINVSNKSFFEEILSLFSQKKNDNQINILMLGIRGKDDQYGGLLADGIMLLLLDKNKKEVAMISIPRDLYVEMPDLKNDDRKEKINFANAYGETKQRGAGLLLTKALVSNIMGIKIDYTISVDFNAFKEIVDWVGGIKIARSTPFNEHLQWLGEGKEGKLYWKKDGSGWTFYIPVGENFLDGEAALYYARSRFSTSDFDRSRRQQEILSAIKDKAVALNILGNPRKILDMFDILKRNIQTDMSLGDIKNLISLANDFVNAKIKNVVIDSSENGLLFESHNKRGGFILLPKSGNWSAIQNLVENVFVK